MEVIKVNEYLTFVVTPTKRGPKMNCIYDGQSIGHKNPCLHHQCNVTFIAEMTLVAEQMHRFEKVFEPTENLN